MEQEYLKEIVTPIEYAVISSIEAINGSFREDNKPLSHEPLMLVYDALNRLELALALFKAKWKNGVDRDEKSSIIAPYPQSLSGKH
ncbi:MAG: hypothetical protein FWC27_11045 [Firmicutes bacterium]|nr:hypothetical protein [Bacillota bacterium]